MCPEGYRKKIMLDAIEMDSIKSQYVDEKIGVPTIARAHGVSKYVIKRVLREMSVEIRKQRKLPDAKMLRFLYIEKRMSAKQIAEMYQCSTIAVFVSLGTAKILKYPSRSAWSRKKIEMPDIELLRRLVETKVFTLVEIAALCRVSKRTMYNWMNQCKLRGNMTEGAPQSTQEQQQPGE